MNYKTCQLESENRRIQRKTDCLKGVVGELTRLHLMGWVCASRWGGMKPRDTRISNFRGRNSFKMRLRQNLGGNEAKGRIDHCTTLHM